MLLAIVWFLIAFQTDPLWGRSAAKSDCVPLRVGFQTDPLWGRSGYSVGYRDAEEQSFRRTPCGVEATKLQLVNDR